jgi:hypothetical protein
MTNGSISRPERSVAKKRTLASLAELHVEDIPALLPAVGGSRLLDVSTVGWRDTEPIDHFWTP